MSSWYVGQRVSFEGHLCTVRYVGELSGQRGEWLGVEWDDPTRGKHNGKHRAEQIFRCLSPSSTAASFIRPSRKPDAGRTVLEAIKYKYGQVGLYGSDKNDVVIISGKVAEEVGFEKIAREQAHLHDLRVVLIDQLNVVGLVVPGASAVAVQQAQEVLLSICPNITELHIGYNPIETWQEVADVCLALPKLRVLRAGGLRLRDFEIADSTASKCFRQLRELHLDDCLPSPQQILQIFSSASHFPVLENITLSGNAMCTFEAGDDTSPYDTVKSLSLENNLFDSLDSLPAITAIFPNASTISFQNNQIANIGKDLLTSEADFPRITTLNISHNAITSYTFIDTLPTIFPNITSLRINHNPLYDNTTATDPSSRDTKNSEKSFYLTLARIPHLKILNYTTITSRDREEGEIYYLYVTEKEISQLLSSATKTSSDQSVRASIASKANASFPQYTPLAIKYARENILDIFLQPSADPSTSNANTASRLLRPPPEASFPPGSLAARTIRTTFYIPSSSSSTKSLPKAEVTMNIVRTLPVAALKAELCHHPSFAGMLSPLAFKLIYESRELVPGEMTTESSTRSQHYDKQRGTVETAESKAERWREWGDWDADALVEQALAEREQAKSEEADAEDAAGDGNGDGDGKTKQIADEGYWNEEGFLIKDGRKWKRREVEIVTSLRRAWGDVLEDGVVEARVRIEPFGWPTLESLSNVKR